MEEKGIFWFLKLLIESDFVYFFDIPVFILLIQEDSMFMKKNVNTIHIVEYI